MSVDTVARRGKFVGRSRLELWLSALSLSLYGITMLSACSMSAQEGAADTPEVEGTTEALSTAPDALCSGKSNAGHDYWICSSLRTWSQARSRCQAIGYDLATIESSSENQFLLSNVPASAWIGGTDSASEGVWRWASTNTQFWQGNSSGAAVGGAFAYWRSGQPDDLFNQDCLQFQGGLGLGRWSDESCSLSAAYVCEGDRCPNDPSKTEPGQCGCGVPDTDTDSDGTADCNDQCPSDAQKLTPGVCGCGSPDIDRDKDGTLNCNDQCPNDSKRVSPGDCGCANAPLPAGTACDDGLCAANTQCDGAGTCGSASQCPAPDGSCSFQRRGSQTYWFCDSSRSFSDARSHCQSVGMDLAIVDSSGENEFIRSTAHGSSFLGASDQSVEGEWFWLRTGTKFWTGGQLGQSVGGAYTNWDALQPSALLSSNDCLVMDILLLPGKWDAVSCTSSQRYVCELTDLCPNDPNKIDPGICGCGVADIDSDGDGAKDCVDGCPSDAQKTSVGQCGCGNADIDSDADGTADCLDACDGAPETDTDHDGLADCVDQCPADPNRAEPGNCGCVGNPGPAAAGTPCFDGLCQASSQCDGAGSCGNANECVPAGTSCTPQVRNGRLYLFCNNASSWSAAQATCRMQPDMDLVRIDDAEENEFVHSHLTANAWLGSSDAATPSEWSWSIPTPSKGRTFWSGDAVSGTGLGYTNWAANRPSAGECLSMNAGAGDWSDASCATAQSFVCEVFRPVGLLLPSTLSNRLNRISDPTERSHFAFGLFAAQRAMCNYAAGVTNGETEQWISSYLAEKLGPSDVTAAKASIVSMCNNLMPAALRKTYLGPLASADPLDNTIYLAGESIDACDSATALTEQPARLRANYCSHGVSADPRALSVATTLAEQAFGPDNTVPYFQRHRVSGAPVLIGLDEVAGFPQTEPITIDRTNNRAPAGPPGDGYNMLGVRTNIPCTTGSCDPNLGQLCSSEVPGWLPVEEPDPNCTSSNPCSPLLVNHCIAYPIVQFQDDMKLIGYNFWDTCSAQLLMTERDTQTQHLLPLKGRISTAGEPVNNDEIACTPSPDGLRLAAAGIASSTEATFTTQNQSLPRGKFYTLQMFNKNGTMSTQHDVQERQLANANINDAPPRAIHVCWDCNPNISDTDCPRDCADANDTHCVLGRCGAIDQTCESDACDGSQVSECDPASGPRDGTCSANLWNATPRDLSNPLCQHNPGEPPRCAETPFWIGSDPHPEKGHPMIFLAESAPDYRVTLKLKRVKAKQETGWDCFVCNDDDVRAHFSTVRFDESGRMQFETKDYDAEFDEGQSRDEDAIVSQIRVGRSATVHWELLYTEHDNFLVQSVLLSAALSALGNYVAGYYGAAIGGAIGSLTVAWSDFVEGPDVMGADAWEASIARLNQAYGDSRTGDLLAHATQREPIASLPHADPARISRKWTNACDHLMHPFDRSYLDVVTPNYDITESNGRGAGVALDCLHYGDAVRQCGPDFTGSAACPADKCFAGRCTSSVVGSNGCHPSDMFCGLNNGVKGFFERRDIASDDSAGEARYIWDFLYTFETCDGRVSPGTPQVCQPLP